jgi:hypothetical protein
MHPQHKEPNYAAGEHISVEHSIVAQLDTWELEQHVVRLGVDRNDDDFELQLGMMTALK